MRKKYKLFLRACERCKKKKFGECVDAKCPKVFQAIDKLFVLKELDEKR